MRLMQFTLAAVFFLTAGISAQKPAAADSTGAAAGKNAALTDGDLILDDNDGSLLPAEQKKTVKPPSFPAAKPAEKAAPASDTSAPAAPSKAVTAAEASQPSQAGSPAQTQKVTDEDLVLDGGEEDLLGREKALRQKTTAAAVSEASSLPDSARAGEQTGSASPLPRPEEFADSSLKAAAPVVAVSSQKTKIEDAHAINFARNLKEYRSPKIAMLMSLILPGSGQIYAKSNLWAVAFGAVEAAVIGAGFALSVKAKKVKKQAHEYADQHYDTSQMRGYLDSLKQFLPKLPLTPGIDPDQKADSIYNKVIFFTGEDSTFFQDARQRNESYYGYLDRGPSSPFIRGWDDVRPDFTSYGFQLQGDDALRYGILPGDTMYRVFLLSDSSNTMFGSSAHQEHYNEMLRDSRSWANFSRTTLLTLLINHVASSAMAGYYAMKHNDELLGKESFWRRIDIEQQYVYTGSETATGYALQVKF